MYSGLTYVPSSSSSPASLTGPALSFLQSRVRVPRRGGRWPQFPLISSAESGGESWRVSCFHKVFFSQMMKKTACSSGRSQTTTGQTALRDADQSPRVDILLPRGDGLLLFSLLTCSSIAPPNVIMLTFYSWAVPASKCTLTWTTKCIFSVLPQDLQRLTVSVKLRRSSAALSTMIWRWYSRQKHWKKSFGLFI